MEKEYKSDVIDAFKPSRKKKNDNAANEAIYQKYFVDQKIGKILIDFEDYMLFSRKGGTNSKMRDEGEDKD